MQAKDIDPQAFADAVRKHGLRPTGWTNIDQIATELGAPWKVAKAKAASFIRQGWATGCTCGCRGDIELTTLGVEKYPADSGYQKVSRDD